MTSTEADDARRSERSVQRLQYLSFGLAGFVYAALDVNNALAQLPSLEPVPAALGYTVVATLPVIVGLLAIAAPLSVLRALTLLYVACFAVVMATWVAVMRVPVMPGGVEPWPSMLSAIAPAALAIAARPAVAWAGTVAMAVGEGVLHRAASGVSVGVAVQESFYTLLISSLIVALLQISATAARATDDAARYAEQETAREAAAAARRIEADRVNALIHDHVLSVFLLASQGHAVAGPTLARLARRTIETLETASPADADVSGEDLVARLRAVTAAHDRSLEIAREGHPPASLPLPVAEALAEAYGQALRNSLQHAGAEAERRVTLLFAGEDVALVLTDTGPGFDPQRVPTDRLGLRVSIRGRMSAVGGEAHVATGPGRGTRVELRWKP